MRRTLPELLASDRNAGTVFLVVVVLAGGKRQVSTTRTRIAELCGLSLRRIGTAVNALHEAGWIWRTYGRHGVKTWFRIMLPKIDLSPVVSKTTHRARKPPRVPVVRKATHSAARSVSQNDTQGRVPCGIENDTLCPKGQIGAVPAAAPLPLEGARRAAPAPETRAAPSPAAGVLEDRSVPF
jgi:hypothetical protein